MRGVQAAFAGPGGAVCPALWLVASLQPTRACCPALCSRVRSLEGLQVLDHSHGCVKMSQVRGGGAVWQVRGGGAVWDV